MAKVIWRNEALDDLDLIAAYIHRFDPAAADRTAERLFACGESLSAFPSRGRPAADGTREMTGVPPYVLSYRVEDDTVRILGIRHGAQFRDD